MPRTNQVSDDPLAVGGPHHYLVHVVLIAEYNQPALPDIACPPPSHRCQRAPRRPTSSLSAGTHRGLNSCSTGITEVNIEHRLSRPALARQLSSRSQRRAAGQRVCARCDPVRMTVAGRGRKRPCLVPRRIESELTIGLDGSQESMARPICLSKHTL